MVKELDREVYGAAENAPEMKGSAGKPATAEVLCIAPGDGQL